MKGLAFRTTPPMAEGHYKKLVTCGERIYFRKRSAVRNHWTEKPLEEGQSQTRGTNLLGVKNPSLYLTIFYPVADPSSKGLCLGVWQEAASLPPPGGIFPTPQNEAPPPSGLLKISQELPLPFRLGRGHGEAAAMRLVSAPKALPLPFHLLFLHILSILAIILNFYIFQNLILQSIFSGSKRCCQTHTHTPCSMNKKSIGKGGL